MLVSDEIELGHLIALITSKKSDTILLTRRYVCYQTHITPNTTNGQTVDLKSARDSISAIS